MNKLILGDCYEEIKKIPDDSIDLVYIDIPYEFTKGGGCGSFGIKNRKYQQELADNGLIKGIDYSIYDELVRVSKDNYFFIWLSKAQIPYTLNYFLDKGCNFDILTWCKTNPVPKGNNNWLPDIEYCLFFRNKNAHRLNDGYDIKHKFYVSPSNQKDKRIYNHPTIKPLDLVKKHILHATQPGDIVLDCFAGSGTTCVAAKELGRQYIGIEINPDYYEIAKRRLCD